MQLRFHSKYLTYCYFCNGITETMNQKGYVTDLKGISCSANYRGSCDYVPYLFPTNIASIRLSLRET